jgi:ribosome-associated protein
VLVLSNLCYLRYTVRVPPRRVQTSLATADPSRQQRTSSTKFSHQDILTFLDQPMETTVGDVVRQKQQLDDDLLEFVRCIVKAADGRKAEDIVALRIDKVSTISSVLVILSGNSRPQNQAIASAVRKEVEAVYDMRPGGDGVPEGSAESGWMLLDYGSVMVHVMTPKSRLYYNVEGQWRDKGAEALDMSDVLIPNSMVQPDMVNLRGNAVVAEEDDPFWS